MSKFLLSDFERRCPGKMVDAGLVLIICLLSCLALSTHVKAEEFTLDLPVDCELGDTCFLQNYFDVDAGPGAKDFSCENASYDGHKGTDIRVVGFEEMRGGVDILAAAGGRVLGTRDAMPDELIGTKSATQLKGRECGNGVVIDHDNGWQTQYCHLKRGSVLVKKGQRVKAGQRLGQIGNSGMAAFPHLHLTVRKNGVPLDPFTGRKATQGCSTGNARPLWSSDALKALYPPRSELIAWGFSQTPLNHRKIVETRTDQDTPRKSWTALVAYALVSNLHKGDQQRLTFIEPKGQTRHGNVKPLTRSKAVYSTFTGRKRPKTGWSTGTYKARYQLIRAGKAIIDKQWQIELMP